MEQQHRDAGFGAGCSAVSWQGGGGRHLFGRNYDFDRLAQGSGVLFVPRAWAYRTCLDGSDPRPGEACRARYAALGMGVVLPGGAPVLYEGVNECGLMGAQLYYRQFAHYLPGGRPGLPRVQPGLALGHLLAQCASVEEAARLLADGMGLAGLPLSGSVPPLHWMLADRTGEAMVVEPDAGGLQIYRNTAGVLTNSPPYPWHRLNLLNYTGVQAADRGGMQAGDEVVEPCFSGSGGQGLPGDFSAPARFVRLAFLREHTLPGRTEDADAAAGFHLLQNAAFPLGAVGVADAPPPARLDSGILPFDYTVYSVVLCAESRRLYWTTWDNLRVQCVEMAPLLARRTLARLDLPAGADIAFRNGEMREAGV